LCYMVFVPKFVFMPLFKTRVLRNVGKLKGNLVYIFNLLKTEEYTPYLVITRDPMIKCN